MHEKYVYCCFHTKTVLQKRYLKKKQLKQQQLKTKQHKQLDFSNTLKG